jgi:hypothetical protein
MSESPSAPDLERVVQLERELQTSACRADTVRLRELLAPDFLEIGTSGRRWDLESTLGLLDEEVADDSGVIEMTAVEVRALGPGVAQVFWDSQRAGRRARRASIWCERDGSWQQVFHQGTLLPDPGSSA